MIVLPYSRILDVFRDNGVDVSDADVNDDVYVLPSREWVLGPFSEYLRDVFKWMAEEAARRLGVSIEKLYELNVFDCNCFADTAYVHAAILNRLTPGHPPAQLARDFAKYRKDNDVLHAINAFVIHQGDSYNPAEILWYEPQTQRQVWLSEMERATVRLRL